MFCTKVNYTLDDGAFAPEYAHYEDAGMDIRSPICGVIPAHGNWTVDSGVHIALPFSTVGMLKSKSGLNVKHNITSEGVLDVSYTGSIRVKLYNHGDTDYTVKRGDKITQLCILPVIHAEMNLVEKLEDTERGNNGFGSTGR